MGGNVYMKSFSLGSPSYVRLSDTRMVMDATIIASAKNANPINLRVYGGTPAAWPPGATAQLFGVDLYDIEVQGSSGHAALVVAISGQAV
ncbi:MAG: hypothetical protein KKB50_10720 [Planctomycetes bacterium]|nr:hypothetical protein [Planctomycetota bacterium]